MFIRWILLAGWVSFAISVSQLAAQEPVPSNSIHVVTAAGERLNLQVNEISNGQVHCEGYTIAVADLMLIETGRQIAVSNSPIQVFMSTGGVLRATTIEFSIERFHVNTIWGVIELAPDNVAGVLLNRNADQSRFILAMKDRSVEQDHVIAESGSGQQLVSGLIESIDAERLILNYQGSSRPISLSKVVALVSADLKPQMPDGPLALVRLVDGGSVNGVLLGLSGGTLSVELPAATTLSIPWNQVVAISLSSSSFAWLSDLEPLSQDFSPLATLPFEARYDSSADGNPMTLKWNSSGEIRSYNKGIGTRSASRIEFENLGDFQRLVGTVGIDLETNGNGVCEVCVLGDDIQLWSSEISGRGDPVALDVSIDGMKRITLVVRSGRELDLGDHVDWADARFVKTQQQ